MLDQELLNEFNEINGNWKKYIAMKKRDLKKLKDKQTELSIEREKLRTLGIVFCIQEKQLIKEVKCVDFYANRESWFPLNQTQGLEMAIDHTDEELIHLSENESVYSGGKRARERQAKRTESSEGAELKRIENEIDVDLHKVLLFSKDIHKNTSSAIDAINFRLNMLRESNELIKSRDPELTLVENDNSIRIDELESLLSCVTSNGLSSKG